ncbi:YHYH protein [uncultured Shewanella sp.]|uniref:YHYH protein n=1 Tax=uncultured Shewanella sp. TaxID=173975 RepID=UPI00261633B2|nr:YHYH protein [uncultured Shewanella sp.]
MKTLVIMAMSVVMSVVISAVLSACHHDKNEQTLNISHITPEFFTEGALLQEATLVTCTLSDGTVTTCYELVVTGVPSNHDMGPYCPDTIYDDGSDSGIWFDDSHESVYPLTGEFIKNLATFYDDDFWQLYDIDSGEVNVTRSAESCQAAIKATTDEYYNYCIQCEMEDTFNALNSEGGISVTFLIPTKPVELSGSEFDSVYTGSEFLGLALNGVALSIPAPFDRILSAYTIAAFDPCAAHINPNEGYHYHGVTECMAKVEQVDGHASLIGFLLDGYGLYDEFNSQGEAATDLDECNGHTDALRGYHYHAQSTQSNEFIGCFHGAQGTAEYTGQ